MAYSIPWYEKLMGLSGIRLKLNPFAICIKVANETGGTLAAGTPVYFSGWSATYKAVKVAKADADSPATLADAVISDAITNNTTGNAVLIGVIQKLNTNSYTAVGYPSYLSGTVGTLQTSAPTGSDQVVQTVGRVKVKSATIGEMFVFPILKVISKVGSSFLQPGVEVPVLVANKTGGTLTKGTLVYVTGYDTTLGAPSVTKADADTAGLGAELILTADIDNNASGNAYPVAVVTGIDTSGAGAVGSLAYLSGTAGQFVWAALTGADQISQVVGMCVTKHASTGSMLFFPGRRVILKTGTTGLQDDSVTPGKTDTATPGTAEANKIAVLGADKNLNELHLAALHLGAAAGTQVTATAAELNKLDGAPLDASFVIGAEGGNVINVAVQLKDGNGADLAVRGKVRAYLSDDANGDSVTATAPDGGIAIGTDGVFIGTPPTLADAVIVDGNLAIDATPEKFKTTQKLAYVLNGVFHTAAAAIEQVFSAAHVITASKFGCILVQMDAAGTISTKVAASPQAYDDAPAALAALPAADAGNIKIGHIAIENNAGDWTANTDDLTNASDVTTAAFVDATEAVPATVPKAFDLISESDGDVDINITESGAGTWYLILQLPNGKLVASSAITFA